MTNGAPRIVELLREALADASFTRAAAPHDDAPEAILARLVELEAQLPLLVGPTAR